MSDLEGSCESQSDYDLCASFLFWFCIVVAEPHSYFQRTIADAFTGLPLGDARITLVHVNDPVVRQPFSGYTPLTTLCDPAGRYRVSTDAIDKIWSRDVLIFAWAPKYGFSAQRLPRNALQGQLNFELYPRVPITGVVVGPDNSPIPGAEVGVVYTEPFLDDAGAYFPWQYEGVTSDPNGSFTTEVSVGYSFVVEAFHDDHVPSATVPLKILANEGNQVVERVDIKLEPGVVVGGKVIDQGGRPIIGAVVRLSAIPRRIPFHQSNAFVKKLDQTARTASDGGFAFKGVATGRKTLSATFDNNRQFFDLTVAASSEDIIIRLQLR